MRGVENGSFKIISNNNMACCIFLKSQEVKDSKMLKNAKRFDFELKVMAHQRY